MMEENEMSFFDKLDKVDPRLIYILVFLIVSLPLIRPLGLPISMSPMTIAFYDAVEKVKSGDVVVVSIDYSAASSPEQYPQTKAVIHHLATKGAKIIGLGFWADGTPFIDNAFKAVFGKSKDHPKYGTDFVNLGWVPAQEVGMKSLGGDVLGTCPKDYYGTSTATLPMMKDVKTGKDFKMVITLSSGTPGVPEWIRQIQAQYGVTFLYGVTAVSAPGVRIYFPGQAAGGLEGLAGAAEYEVLLIKYGYVGTLAPPMDSQSLSHLLVIIFIVLGNVGYVLKKYGKAK
jgi:hypothetical protein